jgi:hypothetical protein
VTYTDEQVVSLLKEAVPAVPDAPARVEAVRRLAARQRSFVGVQVVGAAASVVLILAAVAAVARPPGAARELRPVADPVRTMTAAVLDARSARWELTSRVTLPNGPEEATTSAHGVFHVDGRFEASGTDPFFMGGASGQASSEVRSVGGQTYRTAEEDDEAPPGKRWVRTSEPGFTGDALRDFLERFPEATSDVRYTGSGSVRGEPVALYEATVRGDVLDLNGARFAATFALDEEGRPRRLSFVMATPGSDNRVEFTLELYDFGTDVDVQAPPEDEVVDEDDLYDLGGLVGRPTAEATLSATLPPGAVAQPALQSCLRSAGDRAAFAACLRSYEQLTGTRCPYEWASRTQWHYRCSDGIAGNREP